MKKKTLAAYTTLDASYPAFINISLDENGNFVFMVRGDRSPDGRCGEVVVATLTGRGLEDLLSDLEQGLDELLEGDGQEVGDN